MADSPAPDAPETPRPTGPAELSLVTIVAEALLERRLIEDLGALEVSGYTITSARGRGSRGSRAGDIEGGNVRFEVIASEARAASILERLAERYFEHFAVAAWVSRVSVLRGEKYV